MPPLISCLMVSRPVRARAPFFEWSLDSYLHQKWRQKELVIIWDKRGDPAELERRQRRIAALRRSDIRTLLAPSALTLGALRNLSLRHARGEVACQWDDDDISHPRRLELQFAQLAEQGSGAIYLRHAVHYFSRDKRVFLANWGLSPLGCHPGSGMFYTHALPAYPSRGPKSERGEDTEFLRRLTRLTKVSALANKLPLFVYVCHALNAHPSAHYRGLRRKLKCENSDHLATETLAHLLRAYPLKHSGTLHA